MKLYNSDPSRKTAEIKPSFLIILIATLVLLVTLTISLFVVMYLEKNASSEPDFGGNRGGNRQTQSTTDPSVPAGNLNTTPLYPTKETRTSYKISTGSDVVKLTDDTFITSNNTVLVKVGANSLTSVVEKSADTKMYPASMTKVMTLLVACERVTDLDTMLTITEEHIDYATKSGGGSSFFGIGDPELAGEKVSVRDALYLISYKSDTLSCLLIADHIAGSQDAFVQLMNQKAKAIGLTGTNFVNCTGLYNENHYSTCKDIASIMAYAMDNELAKSILFSTKTYTFQSDKFYTAKDPTKKVTYYLTYPDWYGAAKRFNKNNKLDTVTVIAGKTGYVEESGISLVSVAEAADGTLYINVIVGKPKGSGLTEDISTDEVKKIYNTYAK
ncbi:MAG: D-alanyl-D-alanine carboxypeptidase [Clostridia bacterium]|nr:D-alanyl-D-alanine carboxypeptidase [Clostridia bacterium]